MILLLVLAITVALQVGAAMFLIKRDRGAKEPGTMLWAAVGFGALALVLVTIASIFIPLLRTDIQDPTVPLSTLFLTLILVGVVEEAAKAIPLAWFIFKKSYFDELSDGVIYFAMSGLCFSLVEDIFYMIEGGSEAGIIRIVFGPFFHAATSGIFGYYLIQAKLKSRSLAKPALVLGGLMILHGLYDFGLTSGIPALAIASLLVSLTLNISLFAFYHYASRADRLRRL